MITHIDVRVKPNIILNHRRKLSLFVTFLIVWQTRIDGLDVIFPHVVFEADIG